MFHSDSAYYEDIGNMQNGIIMLVLLITVGIARGILLDYCTNHSAFTLIYHNRQNQRVRIVSNMQNDGSAYYQVRGIRENKHATYNAS